VTDSFLLASALLLLLLVPFGAHRIRLLWLLLKYPRRREAARWGGELPSVLVQVPVYNEANVVTRAIDAACSLDYPKARLTVQVLDDSDDETPGIAAQRIEHWRESGVEVRHLRRAARDGFKAGALAAGMRFNGAEFILVLDADFVAPPDLIHKLLPPFADPRVGAVQAAWAHLDADASWLARAQALFLDGHFAIEHEARYRAGLFFNFNGSGGMWRRACIEDAGGWSADTLTEDVDLSYRAQLRGWRFAYLDHVSVPAELPGTLRAVETQQARWAQGGIQTGRKLLPRIWKARLPLAIKLEATAHTFGHVVHAVSFLFAAAVAFLGWATPDGLAGLPGWLPGALFAAALIPFMAFYAVATVIRGRGRLVRSVVEGLTLGLGLAAPLTVAVVRGMRHRDKTPFRRTPKFGAGGGAATYTAVGSPLASILRMAVAASLAVTAARLLATGAEAASLTALFAIGYGISVGEGLRKTPRLRRQAS